MSTEKRDPDTFRPFLPAWLDQLGLSTSEFRIYAHLWRWCRTKTALRPCESSLETMKRTCRLSEDTVWRALAALETLGLIHRKKRYQATNLYSIVWPPPITLKDGVIDSPQSARRLVPAAEGRLIPANVVRNGMSTEGDEYLREEKKSSPPMSICPESLTNPEMQSAATTLRLNQPGVARLYSSFLNVKAPWLQKDRPGMVRADVVDAFTSWCKGSTAGKQAVAALGVAAQPVKDYSRL